MITITKYRADDGQEFHVRELAEERDALIRRLEACMAPLGKRPNEDTMRKGWIQHSRSNYEAAKISLLNEMLPIFKDYPTIQDSIRNTPLEVSEISVIGRIVDELGYEPIRLALWRLSCIDSKFREHNQPYFGAYGHASSDYHVMIEERAKP